MGSCRIYGIGSKQKLGGVNVKVTTTNNYINGQKEALRKLIESRIRVIKPENKTLKWVGIGLVVLGFILGAYTKGVGYILCLIGVALWAVGFERKEKYWVSTLGEGNVKILEYHPHSIVHAKIYVADDWVIMGSVNLTENGMRDSIEGVTVMQSAELAAKVTGLMEEAQNALNLKEVSYASVGKELDKPDIKPRRSRAYRRYGKNG